MNEETETTEAPSEGGEAGGEEKCPTCGMSTADGHTHEGGEAGGEEAPSEPAAEAPAAEPEAGGEEAPSEPAAEAA